MFGLISWFSLCLIFGLITLWAVWARNISRWRLITLISFLVSIPVTGALTLLSQGWSSPCYLLLPGRYDLTSYYIIPEKEIFLFLSTDYGPKVCSIPWDTGDADKLQEGKDGSGSEFVVEWGGSGSGEGTGDGFEAGIGGTIVNRPKNEHPPKPEEEEALF